MKFNVLNYREMLRPGHEDELSTQAERLSVDFTIDGESVLENLDRARGLKSDLMGCFVRGYPEANAAAHSRLIAKAKPESYEGRVLLYVCPECGDVDCGAYCVQIERHSDHYVWTNFAYESWDEPRVINLHGPFVFEAFAYEAIVAEASGHFWR